MRCCLRSIVSGILVGVLLIALLAVGVYVYFYPRLDSALADAVRREYLLPPSATIKFKHGTLLDTYQGKIQSFLVESKEAKLEGLLINDVQLVATGIQFDLTRTFITGEAELKNVDHAQLKFRVSEDSLEQHWADTLSRRGISSVDVDLHGKEITVSGVVDLKLATVPVSARGNFEVDGSQAIRMKVSQVSLGSNTFGLGKLSDIFSKTIRTPVLDLGDLQLGVNVKRLEPRNGYLYVEAESEGLDDLAKAMKAEKAPEPPVSKSTDTLQKDTKKVEDTVKDAARGIEDLGQKLKKKIL